MEINNIAKEIHEIAKSKGFWDTPECKNCKGVGDIVINMQDDYGVCPECRGTGYEQRNIGELLMLVVSELGEALEADRKGRYMAKNSIEFIEQACDMENFCSRFRGCIKDTFEDEIADAIIRLLDLSAVLNIDIEKHIRLKMEYNKTRDKLHGKKY